MLLAKAIASLLLALTTMIGGTVAQPSFDAFMWAISQQESGGRSDEYTVVNSIGAVGKYQVMNANIPGWSREILGRSITWQEFRNSPSLQEQIVRGKLKKYYNKYGARGAASAWYSGNPNLHMSTSSQSGGPSIKGYVDSVMANAMKYPSGGGSSPAKGATAKAEGGYVATRDEQAELYGFVEALFDSNPELRQKFNEAVKGGWTASKFQAALRDTKWWKTHSQSERKYLINRYGDPASAKQDLQQAYVKVRQLAAQLGIVETPSLMKKMNAWAYNAVAKGWEEAQLRSEIGKFISFGGDKWEGEAGEVQQKLHEYAYSMGVTMSRGWYDNNSRNVARGVATVQDGESEIRRQAKATYGNWAKQIDGGQTVMDLASPYMQSMSTILELPSGSINLTNGTIRKALQGKDKTTGANTIVPLWQFENDLRSDPRWKKTKNAQDSMMQVAHQVLTDFGVSY